MQNFFCFFLNWIFFYYFFKKTTKLFTINNLVVFVFYLVAGIGIEPMIFGLWARRDTTSPPRDKYMVRPRGIEPRLPGWKPEVLTTRRWPHKLFNAWTLYIYCKIVKFFFQNIIHILFTYLSKIVWKTFDYLHNIYIIRRQE